ncbi:hypothetical protein LB467_18815, partial [Salegentibacter sp. JZCK2]|uniref:hypothetical protein n=1 Tax=Salegentibacter tibetensis TaxID=2873600 RepID=UPI001CCBE142
IFSFLFWDYFHDGVASHHILNKKELPAISNWWGGILLPVLSWVLLGRIEKRFNKQFAQKQRAGKQYRKVFRLFIIGLFCAILIAISFTYKYTLFIDNVIYLLLI